MKVCQRCGETYKDHVDFCFGDGEVLVGADVAALAGPPVGSDLDAPVPRRVQGAQVAWIPTVTPADRPPEVELEPVQAEVAVDTSTPDPDVPIPRGANRPFGADADSAQFDLVSDGEDPEQNAVGDDPSDAPVPTQNQPQDDPPSISVPPPSIKATPPQAPVSQAPPVRSSDAPTPVSPLRVEAAVEASRTSDDLRPVPTASAPTPTPAEPIRIAPPLDAPPNVQLRAPRSLPPSAPPKSPPPNIRVVSGNEGDSSNLLWLGAMFAVGVLFALVGGTITLIYMAWWGGWTSAPATPVAVSAPNPEPTEPPPPEPTPEPVAAVEPEVVEPEVVEPVPTQPVPVAPAPVGPSPVAPAPVPAPAPRKVTLQTEPGARVKVVGGRDLGIAKLGKMPYTQDSDSPVTFEVTKTGCDVARVQWNGPWNDATTMVAMNCAVAEPVDVLLIVPTEWKLKIDDRDMPTNASVKLLLTEEHTCTFVVAETGALVKSGPCDIQKTAAGSYHIRP